jgi:NAD(P)-dependent dehydrogenase (short-subunit alcohol dehydrogenase family)
MTVLVHGRTVKSAQEAKKELSAKVPSATYVPIACDFLTADAIPAMIKTIESGFGRLDGIVNCAASAPPGVLGPFKDTDPKYYTELCFHAIATLQILCRAAFPLMARTGGSFIAYSSDAGIFAAPNQSLIGTTRAAIANFCRNIALEVARDGIRVNCISMSYVEETATFQKMLDAGSKRPETARKRAGLGLPTPFDLAALTLFLLGPGARRLTGQVISVNGGLNA